MTSGSSVLDTVKVLGSVGVKVTDAVVLLNRQQGGMKNLEKNCVKLHRYVHVYTTYVFSIDMCYRYMCTGVCVQVRTYVCTGMCVQVCVYRYVCTHRHWLCTYVVCVMCMYIC